MEFTHTDCSSTVEVPTRYNVLMAANFNKVTYNKQVTNGNWVISHTQKTETWSQSITISQVACPWHLEKIHQLS